MNEAFLKSLEAFVKAVKAEADAGRIEDSTGSISATADDLLGEIEAEKRGRLLE